MCRYSSTSTFSSFCNAAIRVGKWKLVREYPGEWELYDIDTDRTELHNLAFLPPEIVGDLRGQWEEWASRVGVIPFETTLEIYREKGLGEVEAAG